jgi:hypothetical protein
MSRLFVAVICACVVSGCASDRQFMRSVMQPAQLPDDSLRVRYFGTGCMLMEHGGKAVFTDPFVSNPRVLRSLAGRVSTDTAYVNRYIGPADLSKVRMVVSGHAHYDHLMDLPYLSRWIPEDAVVCANSTAKHIMASYALDQTVCVVDSLATDSLVAGTWVYATDGSVRSMAIRSMHPPQVAGIHMMRGSYASDLTQRPERIYDWLQGRTHAFLIDFMDGEKPVYRIYFSSSMASAPFGLFPKEILADKAVDAVFLGAAGDRDPDLYPAPILQLTRPAKVHLIHWESFFRSKDRKAKAIGRRSLHRFYEEVRGQLPPDTPISVTLPLRQY